MAKQKLYQHIADGPNQGKVVKMTGVVADDGMTLLQFDDGTKCNVEFIANMNDPKAYASGKVMAEVYDTKNVWTFEKKAITEEHRIGYTKEGVAFEGVDPYVRGRYGTENKARSSMKAIPPRHVVTSDELNSSAENLKRLGIDPNTPGYEAGMRNMTMPSQQELMAKQMQAQLTVPTSADGRTAYDNVVYEDTPICKTNMRLDPVGIKPPSAEDMKDFARGNEIYIPDDIREDRAKTEEEATKTKEDDKVSSSKTSDEPINTTIREERRDETPINTSSPVYSIVSKCKKKEVRAPLMLDLKLPGKAIYSMIKDEFDEEATDEFFDIIISEISIEQIKESLKEALKSSYEAKPSEE